MRFSFRKTLCAFVAGFQRDQRGTAMVELALVIGAIFLPLMFGVLEFGRATHVKSTLTAAAREGVRYAIVHGTESGATADSAAIADYVKGRTALSPIIVRPTWNPDKDPGSIATVKVTYNYVPIVRIIPARTITSTSQQVIAF
jgi:Flp pilus assembly protein TadG